MRQSHAKFVWLAVAVWSLVTVVCDLVLVVNVLRNLYSLSFASTQGVMTVSETVRYRSRASALKVQYDYSVDGQNYTGDRWRFGDGDADAGWASKTAFEHPVGSKVTVYHSRLRPSTSVLRRGLAGEDFLMALMLTPFNLVMGMGWRFASWLKQKESESPLNSAEELRRLSLSQEHQWLTPRIAGTATLFASSFVGCVLVFSILGSHPPIWAMLLVWATVIGATWKAANAVRHRWSQQKAMTVDERDGTITLPPTAGRDTPLTIRKDQIDGVDVKPSETPSGPGFAVVVRYHDPNETHSAAVALLKESHEARNLADALERWFKTIAAEPATAS